MEARSQRQIESGAGYDRYFPLPARRDPIVKRDASVFDTVDMVKKVVRETLEDTRQIAPLLKGATLRETCSNIWHFVYRYIRYRRDKPGTEQVRRPARAWADRRMGVDCDCYTVFISSVLLNLGIAHTYRITEYASKGYYQHIYPVVLAGQAGAERQITLDCVKDEFDAEEPYTKKKDYPMDMQYLDGLADTDELSGDEMEGLSDYLIDGLGRVRKRRGKKVAPDGPTVQQAAQVPPAQTAAVVQAQPLMPATPAADPTIRAATYTVNRGRLKDGTLVELSQEIRPGSEKRWPWQPGRVMAHRKVLFNGAWDGHTWLDRFVVRNGVLRGVNVDGYYYTTAVKGPLRKVSGVRIANSAVPLAGLSGDDALEALYSVNGLGEVVKSPVPGTYGLYISYPVLLELWRKRQARVSGAQGLEGLAALLGDGADVLLQDAAGMGDFEADGLDDIAGLAASPGVGILGLADVGGLGALDLEPVLGLEGDEALLVMDGLGRVKRARVLRGRKGGSDPGAPAAPAAPAVRHLGLYVPLNTLRNLFKLRRMALTQMASGGKPVVSGEVPASVDGLALSGNLGEADTTADGLGWAFGKKLVGGVFKAAAFAAPVASLVPGLGPVATVAKIGNGIMQRLNSGGGGQVQQAPSSQGMVPYEQRFAGESMMAYGSEVDGLREVPGKVAGFVKRNPVVSVIGIAGLGWTLYRLSQGEAILPAGLSGTEEKPRRKKKRKAKADAVQRFSMITLS